MNNMNKKEIKKSTTKKVLKWIVSIFLVLIIALVSIPFLFKDKIVQMVTNTINNSINATVTFKESDLSLFRSLIISIAITLAIIVGYISLYIIPKKAEKLLEEHYPEYKIV